MIRRGSRVAAWDAVDVQALSEPTDEELRASLRGSAMRRAKVAGLRRNIAEALRAGDA